MENKYLLHQAKEVAGGTFDKGIVIKDTYEAALQSYHAYLGAYAYGQAANVVFVDCMITEKASPIILMHEQWVKPAAPAEEPQA